MVYKFIEGITCADICTEVESETLSELFLDSGKAVIEIMGNTETVEGNSDLKVSLQNENIEKLLFEFLEEIILKKDEKNMIFKKIKDLKIDENTGKITFVLKGDKININKHELRQDVKAITYHHFKLVKDTEENVWKATFVVDV